MNAVTFQLSEEVRAKAPLLSLQRDQVIQHLLSKRARVEQCYHSDARLVRCGNVHPLVQAAHDAFYEHFPLTLSPDAIWFCIAQGCAQHVNAHAESLRRAFVAHEGRLTLVAARPDFQLGRFNPWPEVFSAFSAQIAQHVGTAQRLLVADFSTTGPIERAASEIVLMDAFQAYFEYLVVFTGRGNPSIPLVGIPSISLLGGVADWAGIHRRAAALAEYGLQDWLRALLPVLEKLVETAEGKPDLQFWRSFFRYESRSGSSAELTGWIHVLFPYLKSKPGAHSEDLVPNPYLGGWQPAWQSAQSRTSGPTFGGVPLGPSEESMPSGLSSAPVKIVDLVRGAVVECRFVGGLFGVIQDPVTRAVQPEFGWAVVEDVPGDVSDDPSSDPFGRMSMDKLSGFL